MTLRTRLTKLERMIPPRGITVIARAPAGWTEEGKQAALQTFLQEQSVTDPVHADIQTGDHRQRDFEVVMWGDLDEIFAAANAGQRIGMPDRESRKSAPDWNNRG